MNAKPIHFQRSPVSPSCPVLKCTSQSKTTSQSNPNVYKPIAYDNPLKLSKQAYALQQNILSLTHYAKANRLLELCLTLPDDLSPKEAQRRLNSYMTNVLRRICLTYVRVVGRTRKGRIHYHITFAMTDYFGNRPSGKRRLRNLRDFLTSAAARHGFGRATVARIRDIEGWSIYLARHVDQSRLRGDKKLKRVAYSTNFKRVCSTRLSSMSAFARRWRKAVGEVAKMYGYSPTAGRKWIWHHYREILDVANKLPMPTPDFNKAPRTVTWQGRVWSVLRMQEDPDLFLLTRAAEGDERLLCSGRAGASVEVYSMFSVHVTRQQLQRICNAQVICDSLR